MAFTRLVALAACLFTLSASAYAWSEGKEEDWPLVECKGLPMRQAQKIVVRTKAESGSYGIPHLVGLGPDDVVFWKYPFPKVEEINLAKYYVACSGKTITIGFQHPGPSPYLIQKFRWDGVALKFLSRGVQK